MKNPSLGIKRALYTAIGDGLIVGGDLVAFYDRAPQDPPNEFIWGDVVDIQDIGDKGGFTTSVDYEFTVVVRQDTGGASSLKLENIADVLMTTICERGAGLTDPDGDFNILSIQYGGTLSATSSSGETLIGSKRELFKKIPFTMNCEQL